jgi:hypothetical protein
MRKNTLALIVGTALLTWSSSAWALAYTISAPVAFSTSGVSGTINPVTNLTGTTICLTGVCSSSVAQDWLLVTVTLNLGSDSVDRIDISSAGSTAVVGAGHYTDPDATPTAGSIAGTTSIGRFDFDFPNSGSALNLEAGETTDRLFVAFSPVGSLPGPGIPDGMGGFVIQPGTASFMIGEAGSTSFSAQGMIVLVPEPTTALLLGGGLFGLALAGRRRS